MDTHNGRAALQRNAYFGLTRFVAICRGIPHFTTIIPAESLGNTYSSNADTHWRSRGWQFLVNGYDKEQQETSPQGTKSFTSKE